MKLKMVMKLLSYQLYMVVKLNINKQFEKKKFFFFFFFFKILLNNILIKLQYCILFLKESRKILLLYINMHMKIK